MAKKFQVVRVSRGGATGTPEEFDRHFARRHKGSGRVEFEPAKSKLPAVDNRSMKERLNDFGIQEQ